MRKSYLPAVSPTKEIKVVVGARRSSMSSSCGSSGYYSSSPTLSSSPPVLCNPKSGKRVVARTHAHTLSGVKHFNFHLNLTSGLEKASECLSHL